VLDWLIGLEQNGMLLDWCGLEMRLKSPEVIGAQLVEQKVFHTALLMWAGAQRTLSYRRLRAVPDSENMLGDRLAVVGPLSDSAVG